MSVICVLYSSNTTYDSLRGILAMAAAELDRLGHEVKMLDLLAPDFSARLNALLPRKTETMALGFSGIGLDIHTKDGRLFWDVAQIPVFTWFCDHPCYFAKRHGLESRYTAHGYVFPDHAAFSRDHLSANGAVFATHMGIPDPGFFGGLPPEQRNGRLIFAKSGWNPLGLERGWRKTMPPKLFALLFDAIAEARGKTCGAFPKIIVDVAERHLVYLKPGGDLFNVILTRLDNYTRGVRTREVGAVLADYPVDFIGGGWSNLDVSGRPARVLGAMTFDAMREGLGSYLAAVSLNPNIDLSVHDRVFFALGAGTVPVFDANRFSAAEMPHLARYSFGQDTTSIAAAVEAVLADPAAAQAATATTMSELYPRFSMQRSVQDIHEITMSIAGAAGAGLLPAEPVPAGVWTPKQAA
ncbi:hypothetical protein FBZ93_108103 [Bradyrhizobium macuxiense]|uniref:Glycosyl transferase family 1 n=1 Tax=Bradyrhizobium macuxiense TaxID=1755647 RepID=A0A560LKI9_9BRAD|nr:hypothetical protein [Bradyrhizobium macuxiense]TWB96063.1 hypothetical protein FBZ93_108103 [Bradyrhizobium macuxiense]